MGGHCKPQRLGPYSTSEDEAEAVDPAPPRPAPKAACGDVPCRSRVLGFGDSDFGVYKVWGRRVWDAGFWVWEFAAVTL